MISLTDYLGYLNQQFVAARRQADLAAVAMAKTYAEDEYLQHFKVPRFTMPVVKLKVPIKIDAVNQETKYDFEFQPDDFLGRMRKSFTELMRRYEVKIPSFTEKTLMHPRMQSFLQDLDTRDGGFVRDIDYALSAEEADSVFEEAYQLSSWIRELDIPKQMALSMRDAFFSAVKAQFKPLITNINNLSVTPQASGLQQDDSEKLLIQLDLELVEEGIHLRKIRDENGNIIEEILVD